MGLINAATLNRKTLINTYIKQVLNHDAIYPRRAVQQNLIDRGAKINNIKDLQCEDQSYVSSVAMALKEEKFDIVNKRQIKRYMPEIDPNKGEYYQIRLQAKQIDMSQQFSRTVLSKLTTKRDMQ